MGGGARQSSHLDVVRALNIWRAPTGEDLELKKNRGAMREYLAHATQHVLLLDGGNTQIESSFPTCRRGP